ncbi:hypothetical protein [Thiomicrorhabdus sp.]|uniref:hypothetical protein n=1 Tax=Thiomicrorhabdus sp. TaxID=2039724 RepID=UPI0029C8F25F|nr:hypothetical protein [Thiomicrorhabdus sp.]
MSIKFGRGRKAKARLSEIENRVSIDSENNNLASRMKFNFSYFDQDQANGPGQNFEDWSEKQKNDFYQKLIEFSQKSIEEWKRDGNLKIYGNFPKPDKTDFKEPQHTPFEAQWGRFRLGGKLRLAGFVLDGERDNTLQEGSRFRFCSNTFYVVFLDENHVFYKSKQR